MASKLSETINRLIAQNRIFIASKSHCPYCQKAKGILQRLNQPFHAIELDQMDDGSDIQAYLQQLTNQRTVPNIFINQKHVGGCSDLEELHSKGELAKMLA